MKKELQEALQNVDNVCANARGLTRNEHLVLMNNIEQIRRALNEAELNKKGKKPNGDPKT